MPDERLRQLMQAVYDAHRNLHQEIRRDKRWASRGKERSEIVSARNHFYQALDHLHSAKLEPLYASFARDPVSTVDQVIDFLEIDVPAFRCGYAKEWYLKNLKSVPLSGRQVERLRNLALNFAANSAYRREFGYWTKLMVRLADLEFLQRLMTVEKSENVFIKQKAGRMLAMILKNRTDLRSGQPTETRYLRT